jgi:hypothetical protein
MALEGIDFVGEFGTPSRIRTCDPLLRRQMLYPSELWAHIVCFQRLSRIKEYHGSARGVHMVSVT